MREIQGFIEGLRSTYNEQRACWGKSADRFNLFRAIRVDRKELQHSAMLAFLLDPKEAHDQGDLFLRNFIEWSSIGVSGIKHDIYAQTSVTAEYVLDSQRRLDVLVQNDDLVLVIENKVDAGEQVDQVKDYQRWIERQVSGSQRNGVLVYLTPDGKEPDTRETGSTVPVQSISYMDIASWLDGLINEIPVRLRLTITMYIETCREIGGYVSSNSDKIKEFVSQDENLELALLMQPVVEVVRREVFEEFWENVKSELDALLKSGGHVNWRTYRARDITKKESQLGICHMAEGDSDGVNWKPAGYAFAIENLVGDPVNAFYGVFRGTKAQAIEKQRSDASEFKSRIEKNGWIWKGSTWWHTYMYLTERGLPDAKFFNNDTVLAMRRDNKEPSHRMASACAMNLFDLFDSHIEWADTMQQELFKN